MSDDSPEDVCRCGDARKHHGPSGCGICRNLNNDWQARCLRFRLFRRADDPSPLPESHVMTNDPHPRRNNLTMEPAEIAIMMAQDRVEELPADPRLTEAGVLLQQARDMVADVINGQVFAPSLSARSEIQEAARLARAFRQHVERHRLESGVFDGVVVLKEAMKQIIASLEREPPNEQGRPVLPHGSGP